jgi:transcriptional regulator with XRE-family HTH domain
MADLIEDFKVLRMNKGYSQKNLSKGSGVSVIAIHTWESYTRQPTLSNFNKALNEMGYELRIEPMRERAYDQQAV